MITSTFISLLWSRSPSLPSLVGQLRVLLRLVNAHTEFLDIQTQKNNEALMT